MSERPRSFRTSAIVLKRRNIGEADRQVTILTPHHGKFDAVAKGARKPASKKTGHVELFSKSDLLIAKGRSLDIISQAEMINPYLAIREDLERGAYANYAAELLDRFTFESEATGTEILFNLLDTCFSRLCSDTDPRRVIRYFELHLLDELGFRPELEECVVTHEDIEAIDQFFSYADGGVVSPAGAVHTTGLAQISMTALKFLRHMQRSSYPQVASLNISDSLHIEVERIMLGYIRFILESRLQSVEFIRQIRQLD